MRATINFMIEKLYGMTFTIDGDGMAVFENAIQNELCVVLVIIFDWDLYATIKFENGHILFKF